ncbi:MAG: acetyltransferase [Desulfobulbus sp.]|nr:MAG: acetyltransferase [Desulfobulbus sp.]
MFDVFNGDADGICALLQLRQHTPCPEAKCITGVKRDITLLDRLTDVTDSTITVLDISLDRNRESLETLLRQNNRIFYADHHFAGVVPRADHFEPHIDPDPLTCTSLIINDLLPAPASPWAIVGAFGDNLDTPASRLAHELGYADKKTAQLKQLGVLLNYNGYGTRVEDLFFPPDELYQRIYPYKDPLDFSANSPSLATLLAGYHQDMHMAQTCKPMHEDNSCRMFIFPESSWARRVIGVYANTLVREEPALAHALATPNNDGSLRISIRAPLENRTGADTVCRQFPGGGGRAAAAGINALPAEQLEAFISVLSRQFST